MSVSTGAVTATSPTGGDGTLHEPGASSRRRRVPAIGRSSLAWLIAVAIVALHVAIAWLRRAPSLTTMNDDAFYILLSRSLRAFDYREVFIVGAPPHAQYPPGYPALIALVTALFGERYDLLLALNAILSAGSLAVIFITIRRTLGPLCATLVIAALAVNPHIVEMAGLVRSEPLFLLLWALTLCGLTQPDESRAWTLVTGASAILATLTRTAGLPLVLGVILTWGLRRRWRAASVFAGAAVITLGVWMLWILAAPTASVPGASYVADVQFEPDGHGGLAGRAIELLDRVKGYLIADLPTALAAPTVSGTPIDNVVVLTLIVVTTIAGLGPVWRAWHGALVTTVICIGMLTVWPFRSVRFLTPLLPVAYAAQFVGAASLTSRIGVGGLTGAVLMSAIYIGGAASETFAETARAGRCERATAAESSDCFTSEQRAFFAALRYVGASTAEGRAVLSAKEATAGMVTRRPIVRVATIAGMDSASVLRYIQQARVQYIVVGHLEGRDYDLAAGVRPICRALALDRTFEPRTYVFRFDPGGTIAVSSPACAVLEARLDAWGEGEPLRLW